MSSTRPDVVDLIGPEFDREASEPARRTLIICSAPRTGSYELARHLTAAGIGVPHEYFSSNYARRLAGRWGVTENPLSDSGLPNYVDLLRRRRVQGGVFATKLQFGQFDRNLRNPTGAALFENAAIVHLFRPDVASQYASFRAAIETGNWDFSTRLTTMPVVRQRQNFEEFIKGALNEINLLVGEDAGFRRLFVMLGVQPLFATTDELSVDPESLVRRIGDMLAVTVNAEALRLSIANSAPYGHAQQREKAVAGLAERFKKIAFQATS